MRHAHVRLLALSLHRECGGFTLAVAASGFGRISTTTLVTGHHVESSILYVRVFVHGVYSPREVDPDQGYLLELYV
jgi:hypothetical protein